MDILAVSASTSFAFDDDAFIRLLSAALLGAAIGAEREAGDQPAGLRTHIAVASGAALFGIVSTLGFLEFETNRADSNINIDVARVASNVVVGIGFLGAGVVFRRGNSIRNLTTAASLWMVAAIGLACGTGDIGTAAVATAILLVSLVLLRPLRDRIRRRLSRTSYPLRIRLAPGAAPAALLATVEEHDGLHADEVTLEKEDGRLVLLMSVDGQPDRVREWMAQVVTSEQVDTLLQA